MYYYCTEDLALLMGECFVISLPRWISPSLVVAAAVRKLNIENLLISSCCTFHVSFKTVSLCLDFEKRLGWWMILSKLWQKKIWFWFVPNYFFADVRPMGLNYHYRLLVPERARVFVYLFKGHWNKAFLHFLPCHIWWFAMELGFFFEKMKKSHVELAWNPFFGWFRVPLLGLNIHIQGMHTQLTLLKWPAMYIARRNRTLNGKLYEVGSLEKVPLALAMNSIMVVLLEICLVFQINPISYLYFFLTKTLKST